MEELISTSNLIPSIGLESFNQPSAEQLGNLGKEEIEKVATEFESLFISLLVKEMRKTTEGNGFFGNESTDSYGSMFDMFIGQHLAEAQPLGIASLWIEQYERNTGANTIQPSSQWTKA